MKISHSSLSGINKSKILLYITLTMAITIFLLSSILYINFERVSLPVIHKTVQDNLSQISYSINFINDYAKNFGIQVYFDGQITGLLYGNPDSFDLNESLNKLSSLCITSPFIKSIYVWNKQIEKIYSSTGTYSCYAKSDFFDQEILGIIDNYKVYKNLTPIPRRIHLSNTSASNEKWENVYSFFICDMPSKTNQLDSAVILNISEKWLKNIIAALNSFPDSETFIIDKNGRLVISTKYQQILTDISHEEYIKKIINVDKPSGYFIGDINGTRQLITYMRSSVNNWIFIRLIPYNDISSKINNMKQLTFLLALIVLIGGLIASYIISWKIYNPIGKMATELNDLKEKKRNNYYSSRQNTLNSILNGKETNMDILEKNLKLNNINININGHFILILLKIDGYLDFCQIYNQNDRSLIKFAILNISSEIIGSVLENEGIETAGDHVALLLKLSNNSNDVQNEKTISDLLTQIQDNVEKLYSISLSCIVTPSVGFCQLPNLYSIALNAASHRIYEGRNCIIFSAKILENEIQKCSYPIELEKSLIEALMTGKLDVAKSTYVEIISSFKNYPIIIFQSNLLRLAVAINEAMKALEYNNDNNIYSNFSNFTYNLNKCEVIEEINVLYFALFETIILEQKKWKDSKYDQLFARIIDIINKQLTDKNLCVESIADNMSMSPVYLGRIFKKHLSKSICSYINEARIEKAKELLATCEMPINDISDAVGFSTAKYFFTLFKKTNGVTPNEYRVRQKQK